jgi:DNA-binding transcriptional LysR family regulator
LEWSAQHIARARRTAGSQRRDTLVVEPQRAEPWLGIEIRHFAALEALATERSFYRAAARLGYTQGAVSQQLAALERAVGLKLVNRGGGSELTLTEAGERLLVHVRAIRSRIATAQQDLRAIALGSTGVLRLGVYQSVATLLPELLATFRSACPEVHVAITDAAGDRDLQEALHRDELDLAFVDMPLLPNLALSAEELIRDEYVLVVGERSDYFGGRAEISPADLRGVPLVAFKHSRSTELLLWSLRAAGVEPDLLLRSDDNVFLRAFANAGSGAALLPRLAVDGGDQLRVVCLREVQTARGVGVARSSAQTASAAMNEFIDGARLVCRDLAARTEWLRPASRSGDARLEAESDATRTAV